MSLELSSETDKFMKSLGFPELKVHHAFNHYDFSKPSRRILVIGPMGSGKTEFSARMWRDSKVAQKKTGNASFSCITQGSDRRNIFFVRSSLDSSRFSDYPEDALAYRGGYERLGDNIASVRDSFGLEKLLHDNPSAGTWVIDEAAFYDERIAYLMKQESQKGKVFVCPTLILNFRKEIFNETARLLVENATDVFPLTAYCEHNDCLKDSYYTYRYYLVNGQECPALYFDPLIIIGGDREKNNPKEPNYCTRCDSHHYLPGKEYTYFFLKPAGQKVLQGDSTDLDQELDLLAHDPLHSHLALLLSKSLRECTDDNCDMHSLKVPCLAEKALIFLYAEQNILSYEHVLSYAKKLHLDTEYLQARLKDMRRLVKFEN